MPKTGCLSIEEIVVDEVDEELGPPGVGAGVCHRDGPAIVPVAGGKFVLYRVARSAASGTGRVAALDHETIDDAVEDHAIVVAFLYKRLKIARGDGHVGSKGNPDRAHVRLERYGFSCWCCHGILEEYTVLRIHLCCESPDGC